MTEKMTETFSQKYASHVALSATILIAATAGLLWYFGLPSGLSLPGGDSAPPLRHEVRYSDAITEEQRTILDRNIGNLREELGKNPMNLSAWLDLAIQYKTAGDQAAAVDVWEYLAKENPSNAVPQYNLGAYYHLDAKQYEKAETHFRAAINADPTLALGYMGLHELYRYSYKQDTTLAVDVLLEGIEKSKNENKIDLAATLGSYYVSKGDKTNAIKYYTEARNTARALGNTNLVRQLDQEISRLR